MVDEHFAFCQTLPLEEFRSVAEQLGESGYRPIRLRPYDDGSVVRVAAAWTRDGRESRLSIGQTG